MLLEGYRYIESLLRTKRIAAIIVGIVERGENVNIFFLDQYVHFLVRVAKHDREQQDSADGAHPGRHSALAIVQLHLEAFAELVVVEELALALRET